MRITGSSIVQFDITVDFEFLNLKMRLKNRWAYPLVLSQIVQASASISSIFSLPFDQNRFVNRKSRNVTVRINHKIKMIRKSSKSRKKTTILKRLQLDIANNSAQSQSLIFCERKMKRKKTGALRHKAISPNFRKLIFNNSQISKSKKYFQLDIEKNYLAS